MAIRWILSFVLVASCFSLGFAGEETQIQKKVKRARALMYDQKFDESLTLYDQILVEDANNLEAQLDRIRVLGALKKNDEIKKFAQKRTKTNTADDLIVSAQMKIVERDLKGAGAELKQALTKDPKAYMAHYLLGVVSKIGKDDKAAVEHLMKAVEANEDFPEAYYELGEIYYTNGSGGKAANYWREYLERVPRSGKRYEYVNAKLQRLGGN